MKLIHKTSRYYLVFTLLILGVASIIFYFLIKIILIDGIDEALHQEEVQIIENLQYEQPYEDLKASENVFIKLVNINHPVPERYTTIEVVDSSNVKTHYRELKRIYRHGKKFYEITIRQSLSEAETLLASLLPAVFALFIIILAGVLFINSYVSRYVWQPFYDLINKLKDYDLAKTNVLPYLHTEITEFNELNRSVEKMTDKLYKDFLSQKEFNENSSHEMQTPLAIIRSKLELLIQSKNLREEEHSLIESVFNAVKRLSLLNKGLLLITKIDNQQFGEMEKVEMELLLRNALNNFQEHIEEKSIHVELNIIDPCVLYFNIILADIFLTNLISNAVKHNVYDGTIYIKLTGTSLIIRNTGLPLKQAPERLFDRFKKDSESETSIGIGLAIVKKICDLFQYTIRYTSEDTHHSMVVHFYKSLE